MMASPPHPTDDASSTVVDRPSRSLSAGASVKGRGGSDIARRASVVDHPACLLDTFVPP
jgi:hypothetical protein